jgi:hypothetical protein
MRRILIPKAGPTGRDHKKLRACYNNTILSRCHSHVLLGGPQLLVTQRLLFYCACSFLLGGADNKIAGVSDVGLSR